MSTYYVKKVTEEDIKSKEFWKEVTPIYIDNYPWDKNGYRPRSEVKLVYTNSKLKARVISYEAEVKTNYNKINDPVYKDSCIEFFFNLSPNKTSSYINLEMNSFGIFLIQFGSGKHDRMFIDIENEEIFNIVHKQDKESWQIEFSIPFAFAEEYFGKLDIIPGTVLKGNLYKCGDDTLFPHYGCWNYIKNEEPNFHLPDYFGTFILI